MENTTQKEPRGDTADHQGNAVLAMFSFLL